MNSQVESYQADLESNATPVVINSRFSGAFKTFVGIVLAVCVFAAVAFAMPSSGNASMTNLAATSMGEKGMLKRGMITDPSELSPGLRDQLTGATAGVHGVEKKTMDGPRVPLSGTPVSAAMLNNLKPAPVSAPAVASIAKPPAFSAPAPPSFSAPAPPSFAAPSFAAPSPVSALTASFSNAASSTKQYGEKAQLKRGDIADPSQLSPGLLHQLYPGQF